LSQVAKWATQTYSSKPFAQVEDASCLRSGCHTSRLLEGKVTFKRGIIFDHGPHLKEERRGRQLRCTSCHSQIVVGTHIEVTTTTCYLCHFKGMKTSREFHPLGGCTVCHTAPKEDMKLGTIAFNHESMVKRNVGCEKCHLNVVEGSGQAPRERCLTCHNQPEKLQKYGDTPFMHEFHVTGYHIECTRCHSEIKHTLPQPIGRSVSGLLYRLFEPSSAEAAESNAKVQPKRPIQPPTVKTPEAHHATRDQALDCKACHQATHHGVLEMYVGMGGKGTPMIPGHMFQVRVECVACHIEPGKDKTLATFGGQTFRPSERACLGCHGKRYKGMLAGWTKTIAAILTAVNTKLLSVEQTLRTTFQAHPQFAKAWTLVSDARYNVEFVTNGKGVHNVFFAADLLKVADGYLDQSMTVIGQAPLRVEDEALVRGGYCAVLCHNQLGVKVPEEVRFGTEMIPHVRHVTDFGVTCTVCHSAERHKAVTATKATCLNCHHRAGNENERCVVCHKLQQAFFSGTIESEAVEPSPSSHAQMTDCVGCHNVQTKHSRQAVAARCMECHDATSLKALGQWRKEIDDAAGEVKRLLKKGESVLRHAPHDPQAPEARRLLQAIRKDLDLIVKAGGIHNPDLAKAILAKAKQTAEQAIRLLNR
jgi:hypothetical protein